MKPKQVCFIFERPQIPNLAAGHLQALKHKPSRQAAFICCCFASLCRQLAFGLSYINALATESSQIITFPAYQPLTLPLRLALYPTHPSSGCSWISHAAPNIMWEELSHPQHEQAMSVLICAEHNCFSLCCSLHCLFEELSQKLWISCIDIRPFFQYTA